MPMPCPGIEFWVLQVAQKLKLLEASSVGGVEVPR